MDVLYPTRRLQGEKFRRSPKGANARYAVSLFCTGVGIVVRAWIESTVSETERHVVKWLEALGIVDRRGIRL